MLRGWTLIDNCVHAIGRLVIGVVSSAGPIAYAICHSDGFDSALSVLRQTRDERVLEVV